MKSMRHDSGTESGRQNARWGQCFSIRPAALASVAVGCCLAVVSLWFSSWLPALAFILGVWIARAAYKMPEASTEGLRYCVTSRTHAIAIGSGLLSGVLSGVLQALVCFTATKLQLAEMSQIFPLSCRIHSVGETLVGGTMFTSFFVLLSVGIVALWFRYLARSGEGKSQV